MGIVTIGRSLLIRQLLPVVLFAAFAVYAYSAVLGIGDAASLDRATVAAAIAGAATRIVIAAALAAAASVAFCSVIDHFTISRPLKALAAASAANPADPDAPISGEERTDDVGAIARGLRALRGAAAANGAKHGQAEASAVPDPRLRSLSERLERFSLDLAPNVRRLGTMTKRLGEAAAHMTEAAKHANEGSDQATAASSHAAGDVSSVATASEQLLDSIEEISRQVVQATSVVRTAVERAVETNVGMGRLSAAAQKVGDVVSLISRIAAQTNLLALNATIEAARAGEAGRGFAVVAQEVKTLATQTAKATQDITGQIAEMQQATDLSVTAIGKIQAKISEVEHISTIIAAAVHEQGAATQEIARNVRSAAAGTTKMSNHMENVVRSVGDTSTSAASVSSLARELDEIVIGMTDMVSAFSRSLKAA